MLNDLIETKLVECSKCGTVHFEVSEQQAIIEISMFNNFYYESSEEVQFEYGGSPLNIEIYKQCAYCGASHKEFKPTDQFLFGSTINPILNKESDPYTELYIDDAANLIHDYCVKWGRFGGQAKEKYRTLRFYPNFGDLSLHGLLYPDYSYNKFPKWLKWLDDNVISELLSPFITLFTRHQYKIYIKAYKLAIEKYPHIRHNILVHADYSGLLENLIND